jgi:zinc transport system substrate-binding protein
VTFHDAWYYFADEFGLDVVATFEPAGGKEPTPQSLTELEDVIRREKVKVLFTEPQLSIQSLQPLLDDLQVTTAVLDPLGNAFNNQTYLDLMRQNAHQIAEALKK